MRKAIIDTEDRRFYSNDGIDLIGILRSLKADVFAGGTVQGGSTIEQQLVRNLYLSPQQSLTRKLTEACLAVQLDRKWSKDRILTEYLNDIYFGQQAYGIEAAARTYFDEPASKLTLDQAALIAGLPQAPSTYDPITRPHAARQRRAEVLQAMLAAGDISQSRYRAALASPLGLHPARTQGSAAGTYLADFITSQLVAEYGAGRVRAGRAARLHDARRDEAGRGDAGRPRHARPQGRPGRVDRLHRPGNRRHPRDGGRADRAAALVRHRRRRASGRRARRSRCSSSPRRSSAGSTRSRRSTSPRRSPGRATGTSRRTSTRTRGGSRSRRRRSSPTTPSTRDSRSTSARSRSPTSRRAWGSSRSSRPSRRSASASTGSARSISRRAYATLAAGGVARQPTILSKVVFPDGHTETAPQPSGHRVIDAKVAAVVTKILEENVQSGTGTAAALSGRPAAGKTGTTDSEADAWFAGWVPQLATVVWVGHPTSEKPMGTVHGVTSVTGGTFPARSGTRS